MDDYFCTSLYYSSDEIAELLKKQGAKIKIYNQHLAYKRLIINGININIKDNNKIEIIYKDFLNKNIIEEMHVLKNNNGTIIAKRLFHQKTYNKENKWIPVFHGTRFVSMEHILRFGLQNLGEPLINHIQLGIKMFNIDNWASAIFVSPSIFYASKYSEIIESDGQEWFIIIEARVKPNSFTQHESTLYKYNYLKNEPKNIEYRINPQKLVKISDNGDYEYDRVDSVLKLFINICK